MIKVSGVPIEDTGVAKIVDGLAENDRKSLPSRSSRGPGGGLAGPDKPIENIGTCPGFAASNERETGKKAKMRCDMAHFCRNRRAVCATQSATTRVS
jgi:hypothetical protein